MNSDSSEVDNTSIHNSRAIFMTSKTSKIPSTTAAITSATTAYHGKMPATDTAIDYSSNNEMNTDLSNNSIISSVLVNNGGNSASCIVPKCTEKPQERYVWEIRSRSPNVTPASTVLNSPDLNTDLQYSLHHHNRQHQIRVGRSPGSQFEPHSLLPQQDLASPGSPTDIGKVSGQCLRDGEIVVFDDIDTNWMNQKTNATNGAPSNLQHSNEDILKVTKMIGQLPIADYEGSPRRFGNQPLSTNKQQQGGTQANVFPKRPPGFPQRVSPMSVIAQQMQQQQQQQQYYAVTTAVSSTHGIVLDSVSDNNKCVTNLIDIGDDDGFTSHESEKVKTPTFDYLYEFSETRKVLEEFFKGNPDDEKRLTDYTESGDDLGSCDYECEREREREREQDKHIEQAYIGQRLARTPKEELYVVQSSPKKEPCDNAYNEQNDIELYIDSNSRSSGDLADTELETNMRRHSRNFTLSPETTDYDSNCGDLDSLSNDINCTTDFGKLYTSMPVLEDGLSSGHASDTENNMSTVCEKQKCANNEHENGQQQLEEQQQQQQQLEQQQQKLQMLEQNEYNASLVQECTDNCIPYDISEGSIMDTNGLTTQQQHQQQQQHCDNLMISDSGDCCNTVSLNNSSEYNNDSNYEAVYAAASTLADSKQAPSSSGASKRQIRYRQQRESSDIQEAMKEIRSALQRAKAQPEKLKFCDEVLPPGPESPIWVPRSNSSACTNVNNNHLHKQQCAEDEEADTDLETDRLLGEQRLDEQGFFDDKTIWPKTSRIDSDSNDHSPSTSEVTMLTTNSISIKPQSFSSATLRQGIGTSLTPSSPDHCQVVGNSEMTITSPEKLLYTKSPTGSIKSLKDSTNSDKKAKSRNKEALLEPSVLIEGVLFRARYLGSTQLVCEGQPTKSTRMMQAEEAVSRIKAPEGESQPSTEVDLFISTEKIMVLNTDLKEIMMDHALRTISYIADIGDLVVLMARRRFVPSDSSCSSDADVNGSNKDGKDDGANGTGGGGLGALTSSNKHNRTPKMICHVFESDEAQFIAQSIGQAFQVAYMEFLKANGIEDHGFVKEMDYQEVLNSQEIFGDELEIFAKKELQKEVVVPKAKGEILGVVIVESGWGSMLPTVVIANLMSTGAAARCGQLNIGDQLIAINGMSLVGLPLSTCQSYIRNAKNQTAVKFTVVPCPPVVEVKIKRPNTKYQLGFSVQNGVICSLLRGGIAERGGVRVGHRIIEINNQSVVAVPHEKIVNLLATSVGEILMKTMPTSMFRLLTGQENPIYI